MSKTDDLVARLERVRKSGKGYMARCPAHDDGSASLSIREGDDGRVLLNCFAGCSFNEIVDALGIQPSDTFSSRQSPSNGHSATIKRQTYEALAHELLVLQFAIWARLDGKPTKEPKREKEAAQKIYSLLRQVYGHG